MKKNSILSGFLFVCSIMYSVISSGQNPVNWTSKELIKPADLAKTINDNKDLPVIFCVGPGASIPHSINIGMVNDEKNLNNFKEQLSKLPKSTNIVIYCGCCPYEHCPNTRPAIAALQNMKFTNYHLLDLPTNIKTDWIAKGYPVKQ